MTDLRTAAQQALEALEERYVGALRDKAIDALKAALEQPDRAQKMRDAGHTRRPTLREMAEPEQPEQEEWAHIPDEFNDWWNADRLTQTNPFHEDSPAYWAWEGWQARAALEQPKQQPTWRLSCGCPSQHGGILAEWPETDREGNPAVAYGVVCEKHWHEYEARCPNCASLEAQNTELDRKLAEQEENTP